MGAAMPPAYWRSYRRRRRLAGRPIRRRAGYIRPVRDYAAEYARNHPARVSLAPLMPELQRGWRVAFWEDELRLDLAQEGALARLEGRDPDAAVAAYRARELGWHLRLAPLERVAS